MHQNTLEGIPQPTRVRRGATGRHPKPVDQLPVRTVKMQAYREHDEALAQLKAVGFGKSDSDVLRKLVAEKQAALRASGALPALEEAGRLV